MASVRRLVPAPSPESVRDLRALSRVIESGSGWAAAHLGQLLQRRHRGPPALPLGTLYGIPVPVLIRVSGLVLRCSGRFNAACGAVLNGASGVPAGCHIRVGGLHGQGLPGLRRVVRLGVLYLVSGRRGRSVGLVAPVRNRCGGSVRRGVDGGGAAAVAGNQDVEVGGTGQGEGCDGGQDCDGGVAEVEGDGAGLVEVEGEGVQAVGPDAGGGGGDEQGPGVQAGGQRGCAQDEQCAYAVGDEAVDHDGEEVGQLGADVDGGGHLPQRVEGQGATGEAEQDDREPVPPGGSVGAGRPCRIGGGYGGVGHGEGVLAGEVCGVGAVCRLCRLAVATAGQGRYGKRRGCRPGRHADATGGAGGSVRAGCLPGRWDGSSSVLGRITVPPSGPVSCGFAAGTAGTAGTAEDGCAARAGPGRSRGGRAGGRDRWLVSPRRPAGRRGGGRRGSSASRRR